MKLRAILNSNVIKESADTSILDIFKNMYYHIEKYNKPYPAEEGIDPIQRYLATKDSVDDVAVWQEKKTKDWWISEPHGGDYIVTPTTLPRLLKKYEKNY